MSALSALHAFAPFSPEEEDTREMPAVRAVGAMTVPARQHWREGASCDWERDRIRPMDLFAHVAGMG